MDNQHRRITGYRELDQSEIDLMNKVKALGVSFEAVLLEVQAHIANQGKPERHIDATPERFVALAKTDVQTALMYLTRAVAQPTFF